MTFDTAYFDTPVSRLGTACEKWDALRRRYQDPDLLPMWVADMDFPAPLAVTEALAARAAHPVYGYTEALPEDALALVDFWRRRHGLALSPDQTMMLPCVVTGLLLAVQVLTKPGDGVIVQTPVYGPFLFAAKTDGRRMVDNPLIEKDGVYTIDFANLEARMAEGHKLLLLCNPHNPVGRCYTVEEMQRTLALAGRYGVTVICDEIHADFVFAPGRHTSLLSLAGSDSRVAVLCAASKTFNIAGLRQAALLSRDEGLRAAFAGHMQAQGIVSGNLLSTVATRAAYEQGDAWLDGLMAYLTTSRQIVCDYFAEHLPKITLSPLEATYLMWLDCRKLGRSTQELMTLCREKGHVMLTEGTFFGERGEGYLRLNIGCPHAQLREALDRIQTALGDL